MFEDFLMLLVGGGLIGLSLGLFLGFYIMNMRWVKIIDKFVPSRKEKMESQDI